MKIIANRRLWGARMILVMGAILVAPVNLWVEAEQVDAEHYQIEGEAAKKNRIFIYISGKNHDLYRVFLKGGSGEADIDKSGDKGELREIPDTGIGDSNSLQVGKYVYVQIRAGRHKDMMYVWVVDVENRLAPTDKPVAEKGNMNESNAISLRLEPSNQRVFATLLVNKNPSKIVSFDGPTGKRIW